jgi:hypothetical protein
MIRFDLKPGFGHDGAAQRELRIKEDTLRSWAPPLGAPSRRTRRRTKGRREALPSERKHLRSHQTPPDTTRSRGQSGGGERRAPA